MVIGFQNRADGRDGTTATYGGSRRNQIGGLTVKVHPIADKDTGHHNPDY